MHDVVIRVGGYAISYMQGHPSVNLEDCTYFDQIDRTKDTMSIEGTTQGVKQDTP